VPFFSFLEDLALNSDEQPRRKELLRSVKINDWQRAESNLPAQKMILEDLFAWIEEKLGTTGCDHTLRFTLEFARTNKLDAERLTEWTNHYGGYCDCEVLGNVPDSNPAFRDRK
jgi:Protein of unknown function (DUF2695)